MKYAIVFLFTVILSCGLTRAIEYPSGSGQSSFKGIGSPATPPSSQGTAFSNKNKGPVLRAGDLDDKGDDIPNTGGTDDTGNVNDNNTPVREGVLFIVLVAFAYTGVLAIKQSGKLKNV